MKKKLIIAIPTYNRCEYLYKNLARLVPQVATVKTDVGIIVSDNCSTDRTKDVVDSFITNYPDVISYNKTEKNNGFLANFTQCVHLSNSEYVCLLGDDDEVSLGYIKTILEILNNYPNLGLLHYNFLTCNPNSKLVYSYYEKRPLTSLLEIYEDHQTFIEEFLNGPSFISSLLFKKDIWMKGENLFPENCYGYDWLMKIYAGLSGYKCAFYPFPIVVQYSSGIGGYSNQWPKYSIIGISRIFENLESYNPGVYKKWKKAMMDNPRVFYAIIKIAYYKELYKGLYSELKYYLPKRSFRIVLYICYHSPKLLASSVYMPIFRLYALCYKMKDLINR